MQADIADVVQPIFNAGISLRDRLDAGEALEWEQERAELIGLLSALQSDEPTAEIEGPDEIAFDFSMPDDPAERYRLARETIRYGLTCWLDDYLGQHSAWGARWRQEPLASELYADAATPGKFWDEARYAQTRGDMDTLEVLYWCAMLGYRGAWRGKPEPFEAWVRRVRAFLEQAPSTWTMPASLAPPARETRMPADLPYRGMLFSVALGVALTAPVGLMLAWRFWSVG